jgi:hypothetical protein
MPVLCQNGAAVTFGSILSLVPGRAEARIAGQEPWLNKSGLRQALPENSGIAHGSVGKHGIVRDDARFGPSQAEV